MILWRIFGPKKDENEESRRLHNKEILSLYCSPNRVRMIKSRRLKWAGNVARLEEGRSAFNSLAGNLEERGPQEGLCIVGNIKLEWILK